MRKRSTDAAAVKQWLRDSVAPVYDLMQASPSRGISVRHVLADLRDHHAKALKEAGGQSERQS